MPVFRVILILCELHRILLSVGQEFGHFWVLSRLANPAISNRQLEEVWLAHVMLLAQLDYISHGLIHPACVCRSDVWHLMNLARLVDLAQVFGVVGLLLLILAHREHTYSWRPDV